MRGEDGRKKLADIDAQRELGAILGRAIALAHLNQKDVAFRLGHQDQSAVSRWVSGVEPARFAALWQIGALRAGLIMALAESMDAGVNVQTVVTIQRVAVNE